MIVPVPWAAPMSGFSSSFVFGVGALALFALVAALLLDRFLPRGMGRPKGPTRG